MKKRRYRVERGYPHPPGATSDEEGVNFSIYSEHAGIMCELLLFDKHDDPEPVLVLSTNQGAEDLPTGKVESIVETAQEIETSKEIENAEATGIALNKTFHFWHVCHGLKPGVHYAYRIGGPFDPSRGHRFRWR